MPVGASSISNLAMVPVRNPQPGPTVFSDENQRMAIHWGGAGQNGDVQMVPEALLSHPALADSIMKGVLTIDNGNDALASLAATAQQWRDQAAKATSASINVMDHSRADEMVMISCIGPGGRPGKQCGEATSQRQSALGKAPPLCSRHESLKSSYVSTEAPDLTTGLPTTTWVMAQATDRQTQYV